MAARRTTSTSAALRARATRTASSTPTGSSPSASTAFYGNASALSESPQKEGLIYVGTDDGLVSVTEDSGKNWRRIATFPGIPEQAYVSRLVASSHDVNTVYAGFENHQNADFKPY